MSLILDALNRSRSEQGEVPNIQTVHTGDGGTAGSDRRAWGLAAALIVALAVIAWLLLGRSGEDPAPIAELDPPKALPAKQPSAPATQPPAPQPQAPEIVAGTAAAEAKVAVAAPQVVAEPSPTAVTKELDKPAAQPDAAVSALYADTAPETVQAPAATTKTEPRAAVKPEPKKREPEVVEKTAERSTAVAEEEVVDIEQIIQRAESELEDARLAEHPSPFISSLSQQTKDSIPTLIYERHDYSGIPGKSRVVLNGKTLSAGGNSRGVKVEEILPDSVVLDYQGTSFRLRALNSWVNL